MLQARDEVSREIVKYAALRCVVPGADNPHTMVRRSKARWGRVMSATARTGVLATVAALGLYTTKRLEWGPLRSVWLATGGGAKQ